MTHTSSHAQTLYWQRSTNTSSYINPVHNLTWPPAKCWSILLLQQCILVSHLQFIPFALNSCVWATKPKKHLGLDVDINRPLHYLRRWNHRIAFHPHHHHHHSQRTSMSCKRDSSSRRKEPSSTRRSNPTQRTMQCSSSHKETSYRGHTEPITRSQKGRSHTQNPSTEPQP